MGFKNLIGALANGGTGSDMDLVRSIASNPRINEILAPYGLAMPNQVDDNIIDAAPDSFMGQHPAIHRGIENALIGAASVGPSRTPGEAIANIARGLINAPQIRSQAVMSHIMAPLAMAGSLADLEEKSAHADYWRQGGRAMRTSQDVWTNVKPSEDGKSMIMVNNHSGEIKVVPIPNGESVATKSMHESMTDIYRGASGQLPEQKNLRGRDLENSIAGYKLTLGTYSGTQEGIAAAGANSRIAADRRWGGLNDVQTHVLGQYDDDFKQVKSEYDQYFKLQKPSEIDANFPGASYNEKKDARVKKLDELKSKMNEITQQKKSYADSIGIKTSGPSVPSPSPVAPPSNGNPFRHGK